MSEIAVVGLMSTWREGDLARLAHASLQDAALDRLYVFEGATSHTPPAVGEATPELAGFVKLRSYPSDAAKLTACIDVVKQSSAYHGHPLWGLWLAGDEILVNGRFLRDLLQRVQWEDERLGRSILDPDNGPTFSVPVTQVEHDGSLGRVLSRCVRVDLIKRYVASSHVIELVNGAIIQHGSRPLTLDDLPQMQAITAAAIEMDDARQDEISNRVFVPPIFACEPYTVHRPQLRHPDRQSVRMHEQEQRELERLGLPT